MAGKLILYFGKAWKFAEKVQYVFFNLIVVSNIGPHILRILHGERISINGASVYAYALAFL